MEKAVEKFDNNLDIRSFISVHQNMALLVWLLFTKQQRFLFMNHHKRTIPYTLEKDTSESSSDEEEPIPDLMLSASVKKVKVDQLRGFQAEGRVDRKLLKGIFKPVMKVKGQADGSSIVKRRLPNFRLRNHTIPS